MHAHHPRVARPLGIALALLASSPLAASQGRLWVVDDDPGPGVDFDDIQAAVEAAGDGDAILVKDGTYGPIRIETKGLAIFAEENASVEVVEIGGFLSPVVWISDLTASQTVVLRGLSILHAEEGGFYGESLGRGITAHRNDGVVWVEDCRVRSYGGFPAVQASSCETFVIVRSFLENRLDVFSVLAELASSEALRIGGSNVYVYESTLLGGPGGTVGTQQTCQFGIGGSEGVYIGGGTLFASSSVIRGGDGADGTPATPSLQAGLATDGGDALRLFTWSAHAELLDTQLIPGTGGAPSDPACSAGTDGEPFDLGFGTVKFLSGTAPSVELESPVRTGSAFEQTFQGPEDNYVAAAYSLVPGASAVFSYVGDLLLSPPLVVVPIGTFPGTEEIVTPGGFGGLGGPDFATVFAQPGAATFIGLQVFARHLGTPSATLVIDGEF